MQVGILRVRATGQLAASSRQARSAAPGASHGSGRLGIRACSANEDAVRELENFGKNVNKEINAAVSTKPVVSGLPRSLELMLSAACCPSPSIHTVRRVSP